MTNPDESSDLLPGSSSDDVLPLDAEGKPPIVGGIRIKAGYPGYSGEFVVRIEALRVAKKSTLDEIRKVVTAIVGSAVEAACATVQAYGTAISDYRTDAIGMATEFAQSQLRVRDQAEKIADRIMKGFNPFSRLVKADGTIPRITPPPDRNGRPRKRR